MANPNSSQDVQSCDASIQASFSPVPATRDVSTCPYRNGSAAPQPPMACTPQVPCDLDDIILNNIPASRQHDYTLDDGGHWVATPVKPGKRAISLVGIDRSAPARTFFEVVGDAPHAKFRTEILARVHTFAAHGPDHVLVSVSRPGDTDLRKPFPASGTLQFPVYRTHSPVGSAASLFEKYFTLHLPPAIYVLHAESCGLRDSGQPVTGGDLEIRVYPSDEYTLKLSMPPLRKKSRSGARTYSTMGNSRESVSQSWNGDGKKESWAGDSKFETTVTEETANGVTEKDEMLLERRSGEAEITLSSKKVLPKKPELTLTKNGVIDDVSANITKILKLLMDVEERIEAISDLVKEWVPQVGFKFEASASFLAGSLAMAWGWKEHTDHQTYFSWIAKVSICIFQIDLSLSFGLSVGPFKLRVVAEVPGASIGVDSKWDLRRPGHPVLPPTATATGSIPMEVRGEAIADLVVTRMAAIAGIRTGFVATGGTRLAASLSVELFAEVNFQGIDAFVQTQEPGEGVEESVYHLVDGIEIYSGKVPI